jgi:Zn-dependent peptidase ImmA (M78 family)
VDGVCLNPETEQPKIYINPYLTNQSELNTVIHEFAHAFFWNKTESEVTRFANAASRYLYNKRKWRKSEE